MSTKQQRPSQDWSAPFSPVPFSFLDEEGRSIEICAYDKHLTVDEFEPLVGLYGAFDTTDRTLGLPPSDGKRIRTWLGQVLTGQNVVAWYEDMVAGHAALVEVRPAIYELGVFVHRAFQGSGIGFQLVTSLLRHGTENGVETVQLVVERQHQAAVQLFQKTGFRPVTAWHAELEMRQTL